MTVPPILHSILRRNDRLGNRASNIRLVPISRALDLYELHQLFAASRPDFGPLDRDANPTVADPFTAGNALPDCDALLIDILHDRIAKPSDE